MSTHDRRQFLETLGAGALGLGASLSGAGVPEAASDPTSKGPDGRDRDGRPNILVILADDMGFSDLGCYGGGIDTPAIDGLAENGLRFSRFYNASRCCPTRASLLTGQYPHCVGVGRNGVTMKRNGVTIAEALQRAGYNTSMFGKWHLSVMDTLDDPEKHQAWLDHQYDPDRPFAPLDSYPVARGFDEHYGVIWGVTNFFDPFSLVDGYAPVEQVPDDYYLTDAINRRAAQAVRGYADDEDPFFMYVAHTAPHWPLHARPEDLAKYEGRYREGWDRLREERFRRQVELGLFDESTVTLPDVQDGTAEWNALSEEEKTFQASKMAAHAAMVDRLDQGTGWILRALRETGQLDNTLILVLSDNGSSPELPKEWGPGLDRPSETRDGRTIHYDGFKQPGPETTFAGIGPAWASATNTPFRYWKAEQYEGGAHTPCIAHWPAGLGAEPGTFTEQTGHVIDVLPTCLDLAGVEAPDEYNGHAIRSSDGKSLLPVLRGKEREGHDRIYFEHLEGKAMLEGRWKIVTLQAENDPWRLYDLAEDPTETRDLSSARPERTAAMVEHWRAWARAVGVASLQPQESQ
jgi:arylsulfatase